MFARCWPHRWKFFYAKKFNGIEHEVYRCMRCPRHTMRRVGI